MEGMDNTLNFFLIVEGIYLFCTFVNVVISRVLSAHKHKAESTLCLLIAVLYPLIGNGVCASSAFLIP